MTALGPITLRRTYRVCPLCREGQFPIDDVLGLGGSLTPRARRLVCLTGTQYSFDRAEHVLGELTGWSVDSETIRQFCHAEAHKLSRNRIERLNTAESFEAATGDWELQIDAGKVNTKTGWRDVKVAVFAVRERAEECTSLDHEQRDLPKPSARTVIASIETAELFGERCRIEADRLKLPGTEKLSVLGDGAEWIWNIADQRFAGAAQVLDVFHATEYLADLARSSHGEDAAAAREWTGEAQTALLADGWAGVCAFIHAAADRVPDRPALETAYPKVANYLAGHQNRLGYAVRLRQGQAIGSGMIEGTIKQMVGQRLKQTGARWRADHVGPLVELRALADGPEWDAYWSAT